MTWATMDKAARREAVVAGAAAGATPARLAKQLGTAIAAVTALAEREGITFEAKVPKDTNRCPPANCPPDVRQLAVAERDVHDQHPLPAGEKPPVRLSAGWNQGRYDRAKALWAEGKTAAEIAEIIGGVTRNAVLSQAHRRNWSGRAKPRQATAPKPRNNYAVKKPRTNVSRVANKIAAGTFARPVLPKVAPPRPRDVPLPDSLRVTLLALRDGACKFPDGAFAEPALTFCGHPAEPVHNEFGNVVSHRSYCPAHCALAYQPLAQRRQGLTDNFARFAG